MAQSGEIAAWLSALGTIGAVFWGVWQVNSDRRRKRREQADAIHEIAAASERVPKSWDALATLALGPASDNTAAALEKIKSELNASSEMLDRLLRRPDLTDGTVHCGVCARQFALELIKLLPAGNYVSSHLWPVVHPLQSRAQDVLMCARRLRKVHGIRPSRKQHRYNYLRPPEMEALAGRAPTSAEPGVIAE